MRFITPRKAAKGLGASGGGTLEHWAMTVSAVALALMTPLLVWVLADAIGGSRAEVAARLGRPLPALLLALFAVVGLRHWARGTVIMIDDYLHGQARSVALIAVQLACWALIAVALLALGRLALGPVVAPALVVPA